MFGSAHRIDRLSEKLDKALDRIQALEGALADKQIHKTLADIVVAALGNEKDSEFIFPTYGLGSYEIRTVGGQFKDRAISAVKDEINDYLHKATKNAVAGEEFIDSVINRINAKQLRGKQ